VADIKTISPSTCGVVDAERADNKLNEFALNVITREHLPGRSTHHVAQIDRHAVWGPPSSNVDDAEVQ